MPNRLKWITLAITAISLLPVPNASAGPQCPNLSGDYLLQGEDGQVRITIDQLDCDRVDIIRKNNYMGTLTSEKHALKLDGKEQEDSPWLGGAEQCRTVARFVGAELQVKAKTSGGSTLTTIYSLTRLGDLLENGGVPVVAKRQR